MTRFRLKTGGIVLAALVIALGASPATAKKRPPPPPPPPPAPAPAPVIIPYRPIAPNGASPYLTVPPTDVVGLRYSVNRNITNAQILWNLRSAYNVAALNCHDPAHVEILINYRVFLKKNAKVLTATNRTVDAEFRKVYGAGFVKPREKYMTEVYNHFATPPTLTAFCDAMLAVSRDALPVLPAGLQQFAIRSLPSVEVVFDDFYRRYDAWKLAVAAWDTKWSALLPTAVAAPVAAASAITPAVPPATAPK